MEHTKGLLEFTPRRGRGGGEDGKTDGHCSDGEQREGRGV